ncbi:PHD finger domain protein [Aspergillus terreus]|uniref:PHD finger domain protein n=1 Tax=Aspergillus terreus TaxID=33178 RepID=A0A5M3ZGX6_ASPTE|nr:hypothetical protein ATETN484_0016009600 [Aspergillus terreus]GFF21525.1 PHD finger domain protein [Aspergillus terreus]
MARNLRSTPRARSSQSGPATPMHATAAINSSISFTESTRPRKQRRTGRHSRVATDPLQDTDSHNASQRGDRGSGKDNDAASDSQALGGNREWIEPPLRTPAPSYEDTPWSLVSSEHNPVLSTMRPLGTMPTPGDLRKVGLVPTKPSLQTIPAKKEPHAVPNGEKESDKPPSTPLTPADEHSQSDAPSKPGSDFNLGAFMTLPLPTSPDADVDVAKIRAAVGNAIHMASESENRAVVRGLLRLWESCGSDSFSLSILNSICQDFPGHREKAVFQLMMRDAWKEVQVEEDTEPATGRASSVSSLSSAKSLDDPVVAPGTTNPRSRARRKQAKTAAEKATDSAPPTRRSAFPSGDTILERKRALEEDPEFSQEAITAKRTRLQKSLPNLAPPVSKVRSSLATGARSLPATPPPANGAPDGLDGTMDLLRERSESVASSDAEDNRRLTPTFESDDEEDQENNDYCRECNGSGQLLCCDGCTDSYHFSCLNPPLDPANPPEGDWYCPRCEIKRPSRKIRDQLERVSQEDFALPERIRDYFAGVRTGEDGKYEDFIPFPKINPRSMRGTRTGRYDDPHLLRVHDAKGNLIFCHACGRTSNGNRPIIQCDYCPCAFHMDCCDPPLAMPPVQRPGSDKPHHNWMCGNHVYHDMFDTVEDEEGFQCTKRIRRPKRPRMVDIEILPTEEESEKIEEKEDEGIMYRVSEKGVQLDFITRIKRENEEVAMKKRIADKYFEYIRQQHDEMAAQARAFYASQRPATPVEDTTVAILNSRTVAEREAASNLIAFAQNNQISKKVENGKITLLIDQLKANAPKNLPPPETEIASLRSLQALIEQRIQMLNAQSARTPQPAQASSPLPGCSAVEPRISDARSDEPNGIEADVHSIDARPKVQPDA